MRRAFQLIYLLPLVLLLTSCAGKDFVRPSPEAFKLGQTTYAQVVNQLGEPSKTGDVLKNEKRLKSIVYVYATTGGEPLENGVIPVRALGYYFFNETLVGEEFISSFKSDHSNFDDQKVTRIQKGQTTRADVIQMLGKPTASYIPPMVKQSSGEAIGYAYTATRGGVFSGLKTFTKVLQISFDENGVVLDVEYTESGTN